MNFTKAATMMETARNGKRKLANNTYLYQLDADTFGVMLHSTYVVRIHRDGTYTLNNGGWQTVTTKDRINEFSPVRLFSDKGQWFIGTEGFTKKFIYTNGMKIDENGAPIDGELFVPKPRKRPAKATKPEISLFA